MGDYVFTCLIIKVAVFHSAAVSIRRFEKGKIIRENGGVVPTKIGLSSAVWLELSLLSLLRYWRKLYI